MTATEVWPVRMAVLAATLVTAILPARAAPDEEFYGKAGGYPIGTPATFYTIPYLVGSHSHLDQLFPARTAKAPAEPSVLPRGEESANFIYSYNGQRKTLQDYLDSNPATGLLILHHGRVVFERYQYDRTASDRLTSWSMAKTVTAMLVGIAVRDGHIRSIDDTAETYVPALRGTAYGGTPLRALLQMSSGVKFSEDYSGQDDVSQLVRETFAQVGPGGPAAVLPFNERQRPPGTHFYYSSAEPQVLGLVLRAATGRAVADYLSDKLWQPMGAEADASWLIDKAGQESTFCCLNATLRDYGRLGLVMAGDGTFNGRELVPRDWVLAMTSVRDDQLHLKPGVATRFYGYGYQTWIVPAVDRQFGFLGVRGQAIYVNPRLKLVMVHTAVRKQSRDPGGAETVALWRALVSAADR